jgi:hypothetical protein
MAIQKVAEDTVIEGIRQIAFDSAIADDTKLKERFSERTGMGRIAEAAEMNVVEMMQSVVSANRAEKIMPFIPFLMQVIKKADFKRGPWKKARELVMTPDPMQRVSVREMASADNRFTDYGDIVVDQAMRSLLQDEQASRQWVREIDGYTTGKSKDLLKEIDRRKKEGEPRYKIPRLVVGDGPLTASALVQLGPFNEMGLVTEQKQLGAKWRKRGFFFINSAALELNPQEAPLPLLNNGTTRVSPPSHLNALRPKDMLPVSTLKITRRLKQSTGEIKQRTRQYISGESLGKLVAHNAALNADSILLGQRVLFDRTRRSENGKTNIVTIQDVETRKIREIEVDNLDVFTGPGEETLRNVDVLTRVIYKEQLANVRELVERVTRMKQRGERIDPSMITGALPRVLTLTIMEELYGLWDQVLERDDKYWPFRNLVRSGVKVAGVGGKDTTRVLAEFCNQSGPREGYPEDLEMDEIPEMVLYNESAKTKREYDRVTRARYGNVWGDKTSSRDVKVEGATIVEGGRKVKLRERETGESQDFDYVILSLGFEREDLAQKFGKAGIPIDKIVDQNGNTIGLGNRELGITIDGSATGFVKEDFPDSIGQIIDLLGIGENTVALWVYNLLSTRALWETGTASKDKVIRLVRSYVKDGRKLESFREMFETALGGSAKPKPLPEAERAASRKIGQMAAEMRGLVN